MRRIAYLSVALLVVAGVARSQPPAAPTPAPAPAATTPYIIISEHSQIPTHPSCSDCDAVKKPGLISSHFSKPRPGKECVGCSTLKCELRFMFGSCRAYFGEGRFARPLPSLDD